MEGGDVPFQVGDAHASVHWDVPVLFVPPPGDEVVQFLCMVVGGVWRKRDTLIVAEYVDIGG